MMDRTGWGLVAWVAMLLMIWLIFMWVVRTVSKPGTWTMPAHVPPPGGMSGYSPGDNPANRAAPMPLPPAGDAFIKWHADEAERHAQAMAAMTEPSEELTMFGDDFEGWMKQEREKQRRFYAKIRPKRWTKQARIEVTTMEDDRPRFINTGKVINRFRPLARRRIRVVPR